MRLTGNEGSGERRLLQFSLEASRAGIVSPEPRNPKHLARDLLQQNLYVISFLLVEQELKHDARIEQIHRLPPLEEFVLQLNRRVLIPHVSQCSAPLQFHLAFGFTHVSVVQIANEVLHFILEVLGHVLHYVNYFINRLHVSPRVHVINTASSRHEVKRLTEK
jgi:hypothetical protein